MGAGDNKTPHEVLAHHALVEIRCDHERGLDMPVCNCALIDLGWHPTIRAAKEAWARHALAEIGLTVDVDVLATYWAAIHPTPAERNVAGDNKTLPEAREWLRMIADGDITFGSADGEFAAALIVALEAAEEIASRYEQYDVWQGLAAENVRLAARVEAVEAENAELKAGQTMLRDAWNTHMAQCPDTKELRYKSSEPSREDIEAWMNAPSDTASAELKGLKAGGDEVARAEEARRALARLTEVAFDFLRVEYPVGTDHEADAEAARLSRAVREAAQTLAVLSVSAAAVRPQTDTPEQGQP